MNLYIELIIVLILMSMFIFWRLWDRKSRIKLLKEYELKNEKSKQGGVFNSQGIGDGEPRVETEPVSDVGLEQPERRRILPKADASSSGKNSNNTRRTASKFEEWFVKTILPRHKSR